MRYIGLNIAPLSIVSASVAALTLSAPLAAQTAAADSSDAREGVFTLGQITITAPREREALSDNVIANEEMWRFNADTLDQAVKLVPGVSSTLDTNGRRNEHDILVHGFGRWQVPLSIDGIRVYLPADNRLDFSRFLTADIAEVQIEKSYVSVLDGPGGMGGAINLVTSKPTKALDTRFQAGASFDNDGSYNGWNTYGMVGTKEDKWYAQVSGNFNDRDHWRLSDDFHSPTTIEDGGDRNRSATQDWRVNAKAGFTPNATDEYSFNFTKQEGEKGAPLNVNNATPNPPNSYWDWPAWNIENYYFLSNTAIGDSSYVKTRLFYNKFYNLLYAYDDATYTTQSLNGRFQSVYDDDGYGGSIEAGTSFVDRNVTKVSINYREDKHSEYNINRPTSAQFRNTEPKQHTKEDTWSLAAENTFSATDAIDLVAGVSYDKNELELAQEFNATQGLFAYPNGSSHATNVQGAAFWTYGGGRLSATISSRTRFPTIFERFSTRFGTARPNPDLSPERAINYEVGWDPALSESIRLHAAVFYSDLKDMIQTVIVVPVPQTTQTQNVGDGHYFGVESSFDWRVTETVRIGGNYTYLQRKIDDALQPTLKVVGAPTHQGLAYVEWVPVPKLTVMPSIELASDRWSDINVTGQTGFVRTGSYVLADLQVNYDVTEAFEASIGGRNLTDKNYELADGFPEVGRTMYVKFRLNL
ncbi:MAG: TonB-dependent receptor [Gammaproteobacteria bacterium]